MPFPCISHTSLKWYPFTSKHCSTTATHLRYMCLLWALSLWSCCLVTFSCKWCQAIHKCQYGRMSFQKNHKWISSTIFVDDQTWDSMICICRRSPLIFYCNSCKITQQYLFKDQYAIQTTYKRLQTSGSHLWSISTIEVFVLDRLVCLKWLQNQLFVALRYVDLMWSLFLTKHLYLNSLCKYCSKELAPKRHILWWDRTTC